jgi:hypothetical protein
LSKQLWYSCPLQGLNDVYLFLGPSLEFSKPPSSTSRKARIGCIPIPSRFITLCATWYGGRSRTVGKSICNCGSSTLFSVEHAELPNLFHFEDSVLLGPVDAWKWGHVAWNIRIRLPRRHLCGCTKQSNTDVIQDLKARYLGKSLMHPGISETPISIGTFKWRWLRMRLESSLRSMKKGFSNTSTSKRSVCSTTVKWCEGLKKPFELV